MLTYRGYQVCTYENFFDRYSANGQILIEANDGTLDNLTVAKRALKELKQGGRGLYNLITNNCECFANRAMYDRSFSRQVVNTLIAGVLIVGGVYLAKKWYDSRESTD